MKKQFPQDYLPRHHLQLLSKILAVPLEVCSPSQDLNSSPKSINKTDIQQSLCDAHDRQDKKSGQSVLPH